MQKETLTKFALRMGMAAPFLYFGIQLISAPFFPGYSFLSMDASTLGSELAVYPLIFNLGAIITGIVTVIASLGFLFSFQALKLNPILTWLTSIAVLLNGLGSLWAGIFPMPDPRHAANPFAAGIFLFPILLLSILWNQNTARQVKIYLGFTIFMFIAMIPIMSGMTAINTQIYQGLLQRLLALVFFPPIAVGAYYLFSRQIKGIK